jgi:hypothetical protein
MGAHMEEHSAVLAAGAEACFDAMCEFEDLGDGTTRVTYRLAVDPGRFLPGPLRRLVAREGARTAIEDLRARVEPS